MTRFQLYLDVSCAGGGGGRKPDGTPTPRVDEAYYLKALTGHGDGRWLVLDPQCESRWRIQNTLQDVFGWDGHRPSTVGGEQRVRELTASLTFLPPLRVHGAVLLDHHDDCDRPHPGGD